MSNSDHPAGESEARAEAQSADVYSADDALPPVEPPSAAFIVQLFVVPAAIVVAIVGVWTMFHWLAHVGSDASQYVETMRRDTPARWQAAVSLANALRVEDSEDRSNSELARDVGRLLDEEIDEASQKDNDLKLRVYLAKCLGEFTVTDSVDVLLKAATIQRHEDEVEVRWAAVCSLAVMADSCDNLTTVAPDVVPTLLKLTSDDEMVVRSAATFALGVVGDEESLSRLTFLLADAYPDVRYNAATGLCRHGVASDELFGVLSEMLDPEEIAGIEVEDDVTSIRDAKRWSIVSNGMRAVEQLISANPDADVSLLVSSLERLEADDIKRVVRKAAANLRLSIEE
jgi:HEAT repeat protein